MKLYLDADIFLAVIKEEDRYKKSAQLFFETHKEDEFFTSSLTCLEIWFYLYKNNLKNKALDAVRSILAIAEVIDYGIREIESALLLAEHYSLSPADSIHAIISMETDGIVSSDNSFDKIPELKRIKF